MWLFITDPHFMEFTLAEKYEALRVTADMLKTHFQVWAPFDPDLNLFSCSDFHGWDIHKTALWKLF